MSEIKKRERGANYTQEEKTMLADLVTKYKYIIEDKRTGGHILIKKKEAWKAITVYFNSNCTTGTRQTDQLKALYDNMKQKSRKYVGEKNKLEYICNQNADQNLELVTKDDLSRALQHMKEDKVQIHKTGGGSWKPKVTDSDAKVLAIIQDQIEPLSNPYDSGAVYFKDILTLDTDPGTTEIIAVQENDVPKEMESDIFNGAVEVDYGDMYLSSPSTSSAPTQTIEITTTAQDQQNPSEIIVTTPSRIVTPARNKIVKSRDAQDQQNPSEVIVTTPSRTVTPALRKLVKSRDVAAVQKKIKKPKSTEAFKRIYFKKKCENAYLERKKLMQEILYAKQEHNLKMLILKKNLNANTKQ